MADERDDTDRSEDPTQKRLDEALKRGDVVKSQEVNAWFVIAGATLILMAFSATMGSGITSTLRGIIIQHRLVWSAEPLAPKLSKISPVAGLRRLFSMQALANFAKGLAKLGL